MAEALCIECQGAFYHAKGEQRKIPWKEIGEGRKGFGIYKEQTASPRLKIVRIRNDRF